MLRNLQALRKSNCTRSIKTRLFICKFKFDTMLIVCEFSPVNHREQKITLLVDCDDKRDQYHGYSYNRILFYIIYNICHVRNNDLEYSPQYFSITNVVNVMNS